MNLPPMDISEGINTINIGEISKETGMQSHTQLLQWMAFGMRIFFNMENSLLFLADVTLASRSKQYHMLLETYFSVSFLSDVG